MSMQADHHHDHHRDLSVKQGWVGGCRLALEPLKSDARDTEARGSAGIHYRMLSAHRFFARVTSRCQYYTLT
jgi:hypothetical protein